MGHGPILVARFASLTELAPILRAALDAEIVYIALAARPPGGKHLLQLWVGPGLIAAVTAELVGSGRPGGEYPLRLRPIDPAHAPELEALLQRRSMLPAGTPSAAPAPPAFGPESAARDSTLVSRKSVRTDGDEITAAAPKPARSRAPVMPPEKIDPVPALRSPSRAPADEDQTLPGSTRGPSAAHDVSWNVRVAPRTKDPLCGRSIASGKYVLESVIGTGAIGIVFKASHRDLGRTVAIKVLHPRWRDDPELLAVFKSEARAASLLEHANVARLYDYGQEDDGLVYIVMEYLSGYTLGSVLGARGRLTVSRALDVMLQVCSALSAAHDRGVVHRDVKPDNIVLVPAQGDDGEPVEIVKVCDFGIAALGKAREAGGGAAGTPEYMAPEQATGSATTPASDVYACGVVLYEMLTGQVPFRADQPYQVLLKHANELPRPPSEIAAGLSPALEAAVLRALEKDPAQRFQSAREMRVELRKAL